MQLSKITNWTVSLLVSLWYLKLQPPAAWISARISSVIVYFTKFLLGFTSRLLLDFSFIKHSCLLAFTQTNRNNLGSVCSNLWYLPPVYTQYSFIISNLLPPLLNDRRPFFVLFIHSRCLPVFLGAFLKMSLWDKPFFFSFLIIALFISFISSYSCSCPLSFLFHQYVIRDKWGERWGVWEKEREQDGKHLGGVFTSYAV